MTNFIATIKAKIFRFGLPFSQNLKKLENKVKGKKVKVRADRLEQFQCASLLDVHGLLGFAVHSSQFAVRSWQCIKCRFVCHGAA